MPNIEIKAKYYNLETAKVIAESLKADYQGVLHQVDTYYHTKAGRLKLREINNTESVLIPYFKDYSYGPMKSCYELLAVNNTENLKEILDKILGVETIVDKQREVFLVDNIRVHLDRVKDLGTFIEFEAVYSDDSLYAKKRESEKLEFLMQKFKIKKEHLLNQSYIDYLGKKHISKDIGVVFSFENNDFILSEFKKKNLPENARPEDKYFITLYDKAKRSIQRLTFKSLVKEHGVIRREFEEGVQITHETKTIYETGQGKLELYPISFFDDGHRFDVINYFAQNA